MRAVYMHLVSDLLTNLLTIGALVLIRCGFPTWLDPAVAIAASLVIIKWSVTLCRDTGHLLLDAATDTQVERLVRDRLESAGGVEVLDLRLWNVGADRLGCIAVIADETSRPVHFYRQVVLKAAPIAHLAIEVVGAEADTFHETKRRAALEPAPA